MYFTFSIRQVEVYENLSHVNKSDICFYVTLYSYYSLFNNNKKKMLKIFGPWIWCTKNLFGYKVAHHGYLLTPYPGHLNTFKKLLC